MKIAIVTFEGFNEIDSFVALNILNRVKQENWKAVIVAPTEVVTSLNGVTIHAQKSLCFVAEADVVLFGSGRLTRQIVQDERLLAKLKVEPERQLIGSQCSGALVMKKLGLVENVPLCTDATTRPFLLETGATVLEQPFYANGNIASAGGCLSAVYLAAWVILNLAGRAAAEDALGYVAPVGEQEQFVANALRVITTSLVTN
ncbi:MAG: DJ-1/PfpI family protein [Chloroflexi bacterium]|nr:DJ-1/PfpI family protein [Chloroflexota bacterium]OJV95955.1 MAG: AraC family transcriptional regulator [Chloroflexi bacterium 54-19]